MGFVTIKDQDGVEHTIHASQLQVPNQKIELTYACSECDKLRADLAAAQREIAIRKDYAESLVRIVGGKYLFYKERYGPKNKATLDLSRMLDDIEKAERRVAELLAQDKKEN